MAESNDTSELRYAPLGRYLRELPLAHSGVTLSFDEIERIIGTVLPPSASKHREWWANQSRGSRAPHWDAAGFKVDQVDAAQRTVRFVRKSEMSKPRALSLQEVVTEVNKAALTRRIGNLQKWRKDHLGFSKLPCATLFYSTVNEERDWAFHVGGLSELQFNVGFEDIDKVGTRIFRHGVAFSLQSTREMPDIDPLVPKIARFNEYFRIYPDSFDDLMMWHWGPDGRSSDYPVSQIPDDLVKSGMFIFIGAQQPVDAVDIRLIVEDFDRLLPLYEYVEGSEAFPERTHRKNGFDWTPGNKARVTRTTYERSVHTVDKALRHNLVQSALFKYLEKIHGESRTSGEQDFGIGTFVDVAVQLPDGYIYYELKTGLSARSCIREAFGQLMEYSYWPGAQRAKKLVVVGEADYDDEAKAYIELLRNTFSLPIYYQQFDMKTGQLI